MINGDGCDLNCKIEKGYICIYDTDYYKSNCDKACGLSCKKCTINGITKKSECLECL